MLPSDRRYPHNGRIESPTSTFRKAITPPAPLTAAQPAATPASDVGPYGIRRWGTRYFGVNDAGHAACGAIDLHDLVRRSPLPAPLLLRFPHILEDRVARLAGAFATVIEQAAYAGRYRGVYPIKANQQRLVVERVYAAARRHGMGLEAGSKPELMALLAIAHHPGVPVVCNGFKDQAYIELMLLGARVGLEMYAVAESIEELRDTALAAQRAGLLDRLNLGVRLKPDARVTSRWEDSGGEKSKFGLPAHALPQAVDMLKGLDALHRLKLVHFHPGSQIDDLDTLEPALREVAGHYADLVDAGAAVDHVDVGGGLGVGYTGGLSKHSAMHYDDPDYARAVIHAIQHVCRQRRVPEPHLVTESGRALVAHHSVLVLEVRGWAGRHHYLVNGSVFQSLPDHWALGHRFPLCPLHRLHEPPSVRVQLADITCDSDGHIAGFIDDADTIALHPLRDGERYHLGVFLVGAYQETLGDMHNLFGRINEVTVDEQGRFLDAAPGETIAQALSDVRYDPAQLVNQFVLHTQALPDAADVHEHYRRAMQGSTYLT